MAFFEVDNSVQANKDGGDFLTEGGIYPATIDFVAVRTNSFGARSLDFHVEINGAKMWLYGLKLDNNDLSENFQRKTFNKLCTILNLTSIADPIKMKKKAWVPAKKAEELDDYNVLNEFSGKKVHIRVRKEFTLYNDEVKEKNIIESFFRIADKASAGEILSGKDIGAQYNKELAKASTPTYKDGLTEESVKEYRKNKKSSGTPSTSTVTEDANLPF